MLFSTLLTAALVPPATIEPPPASPSTATPVDPRAQLDLLFNEATRKHLEGDHEGAIALFKRAYELSQDPNCLANIGRIYEDGHQYDQAAEYYRRFLRHPLALPAYRETIIRRLDLLPTLEPAVSPPEPAPAIPAPTIPAPAVAAAATPVLRPAPPPPPHEPRPRRWKIAGGLLLGLSAPPLIIAGFLFDRVRHLDHTLATASIQEYQLRRDTIDRGRLTQWTAIGIVAAGGALFIAGTTLAVLGGKRARAAGRRLQRASLGLRFAF